MFIPLDPLQVVNTVCAAISAADLSAGNWISIVSAFISASMLMATIHFSHTDEKNAAEANRIANDANTKADAANDKADTANEIAGKSLDASMFLTCRASAYSSSMLSFAWTQRFSTRSMML